MLSSSLCIHVTVFIRFIYIIEDKNFKIYIEIDEEIGVGEENNCYTAVKSELDTVPKAFAFKLVY